MASGPTRTARNTARKEDSLIGVHPDEEAAIVHALRQSLKASTTVAAQEEESCCSTPLPIDLGDMKVIQTLLVRKRKWKAKAKPEEVSKATNQRKTCNVKENECRVLQRSQLSTSQDAPKCGGSKSKRSKQKGAAPPPLLCQLQIPKGMCTGEIEKLYRDIQRRRGTYPKFVIHDQKRNVRDSSGTLGNTDDSGVGTLCTSIPLRLLQKQRKLQNVTMKSRTKKQQAGRKGQMHAVSSVRPNVVHKGSQQKEKANIQQEETGIISLPEYLVDDDLVYSVVNDSPDDDSEYDSDFDPNSKWERHPSPERSTDSSITSSSRSSSGSPYSALRKFAQSPLRLGDTKSTSRMPPKRSEPSSFHSCVTGRLSSQCFPNGRPLTEDFLAFLCVRGAKSDIVPTHLKVFEQSWTFSHLDKPVKKHISSARWLTFKEGQC